MNQIVDNLKSNQFFWISDDFYTIEDRLESGADMFELSVHKVRHAILDQFWPPSLCQTLPHISGLS